VNELINRDKSRLDIFWLRDERREEFDNHDVIAQEIVADRKPPSISSAKSPRTRKPMQRNRGFNGEANSTAKEGELTMATRAKPKPSPIGYLRRIGQDVSQGGVPRPPHAVIH
jgi:hypothetical protein